MPWLPQPVSWKTVTAAAQSEDPGSMLNLYRDALALRRKLVSGLPADIAWLDAGADVLAFSRSEAFTCIVNFSELPIELPAGHQVLISSDTTVGHRLAPYAAAWLGAGE